jgi:hypothetical protein
VKLVRRVDAERWRERVEGVPEGDVPADLITGKGGALNTSGNTLSLWRFDDADTDWKLDAALVVTGKLPEAVSICWVDEDDVLAAALEVRPSEGRTYFAIHRDKHVDLINLGSRRLSDVARLIFEAIDKREQVHEFTRREVLEGFARAARDRRIQLANLPKELSSEIAPIVAEIAAAARASGDGDGG